MNDKNQKIFPFTHGDFETTTKLLGLARILCENSKKEKADVSNILGYTILYVSITEYLAQYLLNSLRELVKNNTYIGFYGMMYIDETKRREKFTLGQYVNELKKYNFPDCQEIIRLFDEITKLRNIVFHNLSKMNREEIPKIDKSMEEIPQLVEDLIIKIDTISEGFRKMIYPKKADEKKTEDKTVNSDKGNPNGTT